VFYINFLTRKVIVQFLYEHFIDFKENLFEHMENAIKDPDHMLSEAQIDYNLFKDILEDLKVFDFDEVLEKYDAENEISYAGRAVLYAAFSELDAKKIFKKIILADYVKLAYMFCDDESKKINKIIDKFASEL